MVRTSQICSMPCVAQTSKNSSMLRVEWPSVKMTRSELLCLTAMPSLYANAAEKLEAGERLTPADAALLWREASDADLRRWAAGVRARYHAADQCTYLIMRIVNYTNVCVAQCDYCAFYRLPQQAGGYVLSREQVFAKIDELLALGGDLAGFNGGFNPHLPLD